MDHNVHENVFATGISLEEIESIKSGLANKHRLAVQSIEDDGTQDQLSKKSKGYLVWLLECCDNIVKSIATGDNYQTTCVKIGVLRQEMANIIPPLLSTSRVPMSLPSEFIQAVHKGNVSHDFYFNSFTTQWYQSFVQVAESMGITVSDLNYKLAKGEILPEAVLGKILI